jgi:hypothetical protein
MRAMTAIPLTRPRPLALRPLALPTEHGGWGFLFEPLVLGLAVRPSTPGALVALAFIFAFLVRQPLKLALQDLLREKSYPRTKWCWLFASAYAVGGIACLATAIGLRGWMMAIPMGLVAPLGVMQLFYDANNRSRALLAELGGSVAMSSSVVAIALAGGMRILPAFALGGIIVARSIPSIIFVRTLLTRAHGQAAASWPALALHAIAILVVALFASRYAIAAMVLLFGRAAWTLARPVPPAKTVGWREIAWGAVTVLLVAIPAIVR